MEVLGSVQHRPSVQSSSHIESPHGTLTEIRLRFSRVKFWLAAGCQFNISVARTLYSANLIPHPPPRYGLRTCGHYEELKNIYNREQQVARDQLNYFYKMGGKPEFITSPQQSDPSEPTPAEIVSRAIYPSLLREHMHANAHVTSDHDKELDSPGHLIRKVVR